MARFYGPSTIFIDEIDALLSERKNNDHEASTRIKTQFLIELNEQMEVHDKLSNRVIVVGATNRP